MEYEDLKKFNSHLLSHREQFMGGVLEIHKISYFHHIAYFVIDGYVFNLDCRLPDTSPKSIDYAKSYLVRCIFPAHDKGRYVEQVQKKAAAVNALLEQEKQKQVIAQKLLQFITKDSK